MYRRKVGVRRSPAVAQSAFPGQEGLQAGRVTIGDIAVDDVDLRPAAHVEAADRSRRVRLDRAGGDAAALQATVGRHADRARYALAVVSARGAGGERPGGPAARAGRVEVARLPGWTVAA